MNNSFWKNKKVFVTGHTGFKGAWLSLVLKRLGADVYGYSIDVPTNPSLFEELKLDKLINKDIRADINDIQNLKSEMIESKPDIVIHLAAQSLVRKSYLFPLETYKTNVIGTLNVLDAIREIKTVKSCLVVTTDKCYENNEWSWGYREVDKLGGKDPYSSSKACTEILTKSFRESFFDENKIRISTARAGNVIGGGDWAEDRIITDIVHSIVNNQKLVLRNPKAIRPWQHVLEPVKAYLKIAELNYMNEVSSDCFNVGPDGDSERDVEWVAREFYNSWNVECSWDFDKKNNPPEAKFLKLDNSKIKQVIGWSPKNNIIQTVKMTADWYRTYYENKEAILEKTLSQIDEMMEIN